MDCSDSGEQLCVLDACYSDAIASGVQERAHKHALQRVLRADAFALEHKRVNDWDLSYAMATFANQYRQELRSDPGLRFYCCSRFAGTRSSF